MPGVTLIYLCWNEEEAIARTLGEAQRWCEGHLERWEVLVVDDGSTDRSAAIVEEIVQREPRVRLLRHGQNQGMGAGLRTGIAAAEMPYFCMMAADGQVPVQALESMLPLLEQASIVLSTYGNRPNSPLRTALSRGLRLFMRLLVGVSFELEGTYLFPVALARDEIGLDSIGSQTFFFSFELIARAIQRGHSVAGTVIASRERRDGGGSRVANLARIRRVANEVLDLRRRLRAEGR